MQLNFLVSGSDQMVDDVRGRRVAAGRTEPFVAGQTFDDASRVVDATVAAFWSVHDRHVSERMLLTSMRVQAVPPLVPGCHSDHRGHGH